MRTNRFFPGPLYAAVLIGGKSSRMGQPKHLLSEAGSSWLERIVAVASPFVDAVVLAGNGEVPAGLSHLTRVADAGDVGGPLAGILAALRSQPQASWLILACDLPAVHAEAIGWLLAEVRQGDVAVLPSLDSRDHGPNGSRDGQRIEPLLAWYNATSLPYLEEIAASGNWRINQLRHVEGVRSPQVPLHLQAAWNNINTPEQLQRYQNRPAADASEHHRARAEDTCSQLRPCPEPGKV